MHLYRQCVVNGDHNACAETGVTDIELQVGLEKVGGGMYILGKAYEVLMIGVDVRQLNVNQQQNLDKRQKIMIRMERSQLNPTYRSQT